MKRKELILGISAILAGALICGCSGKNVSVIETDSNVTGINSEDNKGSKDPADISDEDANGINSEDNKDSKDSANGAGEGDVSNNPSNNNSKNPSFSKKYIAGIDFGGKPFWYDEIYETVSATLIYTTDKTIEVYMGQSLYDNHDILVGTVSLDDKTYSRVEKAIDQKMLYKIDPGTDENLCDGFFRYINLYDENDKLLKEVGAYEPTNQKFLDVYYTLQECIPYEEVHEIYEKQKQVMRYNDCLSNIGNLTGDNLIATEAQKIITPFEDGEMVSSEEWIDDTQKCFRIKIVNKEDNRLKKDYFFYHEDAKTVIPIAVDYPGADEVGANRYIEYNWGETEAKLDDVNFDGHEDLLITLDREEGNHNKIRCAYIFENGEFVYNPSFEKITNYRADHKNAVILSELIDGKAIKKKYSYDKESKTFVEIE